MAPALLRSSSVSKRGTTRCVMARGCAWLRLLVLSAADCETPPIKSATLEQTHRLTISNQACCNFSPQACCRVTLRATSSAHTFSSCSHGLIWVL